MIYVASITHDTKHNTLEALWLQEVVDPQGDVTDLAPYKRTNYSAAQKAAFLTDLNTVGVPVDGTKYCTMAGW